LRSEAKRNRRCHETQHIETLIDDYKYKKSKRNKQAEDQISNKPSQGKLRSEAKI